jgi:hypothetical protein
MTTYKPMLATLLPELLIVRRDTLAATRNSADTRALLFPRG